MKREMPSIKESKYKDKSKMNNMKGNPELHKQYGFDKMSPEKLKEVTAKGRAASAAKAHKCKTMKLILKELLEANNDADKKSIMKALIKRAKSTDIAGASKDTELILKLMGELKEEQTNQNTKFEIKIGGEDVSVASEENESEE